MHLYEGKLSFISNEDDDSIRQLRNDIKRLNTLPEEEEDDSFIRTGTKERIIDRAGACTGEGKHAANRRY
jgi:hypothetical protein